MMALKTTLEQLEAVQTAIAEAEEAQSMSMGGSTHIKANLDVLYKREGELRQRYQLESNQGYGRSFAKNAGRG